VRHLTWSIVVLAVCSASTRADIIYQNNTNFIFPDQSVDFVPFVDDGTPGRPLGNHLGGTVTFAGTSRFLNSVTLGINNHGVTYTYTLALYAGANPNTGTLLGTATLDVAPVFVGMETFSFPSLLVPDTITFVLSSSSGTGFPDGPIASNIAPTAGSGPNSLWYGFGPGSFTANSTWAVVDGANTNYLVAQFDASPTAVPEPASLALAGLGLVSLLGYRWRRQAA
jgi:hypothetical protein